MLLGIIAVGSLVPALGRWHWLADLPSHFVAHYATATCALVLWLGYGHRWRLAALAIGLLLVHGAQLGPYWSPRAADRQADKPKETIRLAQFNTRHQVENRARVMAWLRRQVSDLDVLALMEIDPGWSRSLIALQAELAGGGWQFTPDRNGVALLSRLPIESFSIRTLGSGTLPTLVLRLRTPAPMVVYAAHLRPPTSDAKWSARNRQLEAIATAIRGERDGNIVMLGDLNSSAWSYWFRHFLAVARLEDAQSGRGLQTTWAPVWAPMVVGLPIDHTLVSSGVRVLSREFGPRLGSDHRPVITTIGLPGAGAPPESARVRTLP